MVNEEEQPNEGKSSFDNTEETSCEKASVRACDTDRSEDCWAVIVDSVSKLVYEWLDL
jgi:hypothetical protein